MTIEKITEPTPKIIEPYETLRPCRNRIIAGGVIILIAFGLILLISD